MFEPSTVDKTLDHQPQNELPDSLEMSLNNVSRVLLNLNNRVNSLKQNCLQENVKPQIDRLYEYFVGALSLVPETSQSLAGLASLSKKRKISKSDKQRFVINKSKEAGRKPSKQMKKPSSSEKLDIEKSLLQSVIKKPELNLESEDAVEKIFNSKTDSIKEKERSTSNRQLYIFICKIKPTKERKRSATKGQLFICKTKSNEERKRKTTKRTKTVVK